MRYLLSQLLRNSKAAEQLTQLGDLELLVVSVTEFCPPHNLIWRETASSTLTTLPLTQKIINYIERTNCISKCIDNMKKLKHFSPLEIVEMFVTLFCLLKDSSTFGAKLLEEFDRHKGYEFLKEFLIKFVSVSKEI